MCFLIGGLWIAACDSDGPERPDGTPPGTIDDLHLLRRWGDSTWVTWTAPGDDGDRGRAAAYDVRVFNNPLRDWWEVAPSLAEAPVPRQAGEPETLLFRRSATIPNFFVALEAIDDAGNRSARSNELRVSSADTVAPAEVRDLEAIEVTPHGATLAFTAPGDDGNLGKASFYQVEVFRYDPHPRRVNLVDPSMLPAPDPAGTPQHIRLTVFSPSTTYGITVAGRDDAGNFGAVADTLRFTTPLDDVPPGRVTGLTLLEGTVSRAVIAWVVSGNDGDEAPVEHVDLRYGFQPFDWDTATPVSGVPAPGPPGSSGSATIADLVPARAYGIAARARDAAGLSGPPSEILEFETIDEMLPGGVSDLAFTGMEPRAASLRFTAPGEDGDIGRVSGYEVRASTSPLDEEHWESGTLLSITSGTPVDPGQRQELRAYGLDPEGSYLLGLRALDDGGNLGPVSNSINVATPIDDIPPGRISDLAVMSVALEEVVLTWTATGNDGPEGRALYYRLRYHNRPMIWNDFTRLGTEVPVDILPGNPGTPETLRVEVRPAGVQMWFAVVAVDERGYLGEVSNSPVVLVPRTPRTITVLADGSSDAATVQAGIDMALQGDVVRVGPGTWRENLEFGPWGFRLESIEGPEVTILDGSGDEESVIRIRGETLDTEVTGFTIRGGAGRRAPAPFGGGIDARGGGRLTIRGNIFENNRSTGARGAGGGVLCISDTQQPLELSLVGNRFENNEATAGGGGVALAEPMQAEVIGNTFRGNRAGIGGGLLGVDTVTFPTGLGPKLVVRDNVFEGNVASEAGGGMHLVRAEGQIFGNRLQSNVGFQGGGVSIVTATTRTLELHDNTLIENRAGRFGGGMFIQGGGPVILVRNRFLRNVAENLEELPGGGAIYAVDVAGAILQNTFVGNAAVSSSQCLGATVKLGASSTEPYRIERNIFVQDETCAIICSSTGPTVSLRENLFWPDADPLAYDLGNCLDPDWEAANIVADPLFCAPESDDYRVAGNSPAVTGPVSIGAYPTPGCPPRTGVTWTGIRRVSGR